MKSGVRDIIIIVLCIVLAIVIGPYIMKLIGGIIRIVVIIALAYILFIVLKQLTKEYWDRFNNSPTNWKIEE